MHKHSVGHGEIASSSSCHTPRSCRTGVRKTWLFSCGLHAKPKARHHHTTINNLETEIIPSRELSPCVSGLPSAGGVTPVSCPCTTRGLRARHPEAWWKVPSKTPCAFSIMGVEAIFTTCSGKKKIVKRKESNQQWGFTGSKMSRCN